MKCAKKKKKAVEERKKDLTEPVLLEMDGYAVNQALAESSEQHGTKELHLS